MAHKYTSSGSLYNRIGLTSSEIGSPAIDMIIDAAENELDLVTGRLWGPSGTSYTPLVTEYQNGPTKDVFENKKTTFLTNNYPILAIGSIQFLNTDGTAATTYSGLSWTQIAAGSYQTADFWVEPDQGKVSFVSAEIPVGTRNVRIFYNYGFVTVNQEISTLAECLAGIRAWLAFLGGKYNFIGNYSIPEQSVNKGDIFQRGQQMISILTEEAERIYARIGKREKVLAFMTQGSR